MPRVRALWALIGATALVASLAGCDAGGASGSPVDEEPTSPSAATSSPTASEQPTSPSPTPSPSPSAEPEPTPTETAEPAVLAPGDEGDQVRELQSRLKQVQWYAPKITGSYDPVTARAVKGFQEKRGFSTPGEVDQRTWNRLLKMTRKPTDDEMHNRLVPGPTIIGPGDDGVEVRELQARLKQIAWFHTDVTPHYGDVTEAAVSGFQDKRGFPSTGEVDQRTWDRLLEMTREPTDDELHNRSSSTASTNAPLDARCRTGRALCIDKSTRTLRWVVDGSVQRTLDVRFGAAYTPTREGLFHVGWKSIDHVSSLYDSEMPYAMFFSGGQAVHYSSDFAARGYAGASHGCVNVRDRAGIAAVFGQVAVGDKVVVYWS